MQDHPPSQKPVSGPPPADRPARAKPKKPGEMTQADRLKAALKANMGRRKAQARARAGADENFSARPALSAENDNIKNLMDE